MTPPLRDNNMESRVNRLEGQMVEVFTRLKPIDKWIDETREFNQTMSEFKTELLAKQEAEREHHDEQHKQNSLKLNIITILIAFAALIVTAIGVVVAINQVHHARTTPLVTHHQELPRTDAESTLPPSFQER